MVMARQPRDYARKDHSKDEEKIEIYRKERETGIIEAAAGEGVCVGFVSGVTACENLSLKDNNDNDRIDTECVNQYQRQRLACEVLGVQRRRYLSLRRCWW